MSRRPSRLFRIGMFVFLWGAVGYALGTATLLGPVRWVTNMLRVREASESSESLAIMALIGALVVSSALLAALLTWVVVRTSDMRVQFAVPTVALVAALASVWVWMTPSLLGGNANEVVITTMEPGTSVEGTEDGRLLPTRFSSGGSGERASNARGETRFVFGPYPERDRLTRLKSEGVDAVISLLHPAVVPFEPKLLADERRAAAAVGIEFIHLPMLPWVGDNEESLNQLRSLAASPGVYYVHCYLGRDRVRLAQAVVRRSLELAGKSAGSVTVADGMAMQPKTIDDVEFERGQLHSLSDGDVLLTPYPTDEEFATYVVPESWGAVVSLLDPESDRDRKLIDKERTILARYGLELRLMPISTAKYDPEHVRQVVDAVRRLPKPVLVHAFLGASSGRAPAAEAFLLAWLSDLPTVPPSLFKSDLSGGPLQVLAPNVVIGPRPQSREYGSLKRRGVRHVLSVGRLDTDGLPESRTAAAAAGVVFSSVNPQQEPRWMDRLSSDGPWYVFGPSVEGLAPQLTERFGASLALAAL